MTLDSAEPYKDRAARSEASVAQVDYLVDENGRSSTSGTTRHWPRRP